MYDTIFKKKVMGTQNVIALINSSGRSVLEWTPEFLITSVANKPESLASARLRR